MDKVSPACDNLTRERNGRKSGAIAGGTLDGCNPLQPREQTIVSIGFGGAEGPDALQGRKIALS
jgi:hypothetical protein